MTRHAWLTVLSTLALGSGLGCDQLLGAATGDPTTVPPAVQVGALELRHGPSIEQLAAYYCPKVISDPIVSIGCAVALGAPPARSQLVFEFGLTLNIHNPNDVPVPTADVLVALTLFDGVDAEALAAICVSLCGTDNPECDGTPRPGACMARQDDIFTIEDFVSAIPGLIEKIATGEAAEELKKSTILAGGDVSITLAFYLGVDQALNVFEKTATAYVEDELAGRTGSLSVPVSAEGTVFFDLPVLGRLGVNFGPFRTSWSVL